jgi:hypothetical protein
LNNIKIEKEKPEKTEYIPKKPVKKSNWYSNLDWKKANTETILQKEYEHETIK